MSERVMTVVIERDGDMWTAQCDPFDIATQGNSLTQLLHRLMLQVQVEVECSGGLENVPKLPTAEDVRGILSHR